jgi:septal ring factor EnvC (AmiA/AmiB activator)
VKVSGDYIGMGALHKQGPLPVNLTQEADDAFMLELKRTDAPRYARLMANVQQGQKRLRQLQRNAKALKGGRPKLHETEAARRRANREYQRAFRERRKAG